MNLGLSISLTSALTLLGDYTQPSATFGVDSFTLSQPVAGGSFEGAVVFTAADARTAPVDWVIVLTGAGETPDVDQILAGNTDDDTPAISSVSGTVAADGVLTGTATVDAGTYDAHFAAIDDAGRKSSTPMRVIGLVVNEAVTAPLIQHLGATSSPGTGTSTPTAPIDVSGMAVGDLLGFYFSATFWHDTPTVNGKAATQVDKWLYGGQKRGGLYYRALEADDISTGTINVGVNLTNGDGGSAIAHPVWAFDLFTADPTAVLSVVRAEDATSLSYTVSDTDNTLYHIMSGEKPVFEQAGGVTYSPDARVVSLAGGSNHGLAAAIVQNAPVGSNTFTVSNLGGGFFVAVILAAEAS